MTWFHTNTYSSTLSEGSVLICPNYQPHPPVPADFVAYLTADSCIYKGEGGGILSNVDPTM